MQAEASDLKLSQAMGAWDRGPKSLLVYRHKGTVQDFFLLFLLLVVLVLVFCVGFFFFFNSSHPVGPKYIFILRTIDLKHIS